VTVIRHGVADETLAFDFRKHEIATGQIRAAIIIGRGHRFVAKGRAVHAAARKEIEQSPELVAGALQAQGGAGGTSNEDVLLSSRTSTYGTSWSV
jgi:hypothetical protein